MAKFVMECPSCGRFAEGKTGFFARKKIKCACGYTINVRTDKLTGRECPHCGNMVVFDQSKGKKAVCPVCREPINTFVEQTHMEEISCQQCGVRLKVNKAARTYVCPVCDFENDVVERVMSEKIKRDGLASIIKYEGDNETLVWKHPIEDFNMGSQLIVHLILHIHRIDHIAARHMVHIVRIIRIVIHRIVPAVVLEVVLKADPGLQAHLIRIPYQNPVRYRFRKNQLVTLLLGLSLSFLQCLPQT